MAKKTPDIIHNEEVSKPRNFSNCNRPTFRFYDDCGLSIDDDNADPNDELDASIARYAELERMAQDEVGGSNDNFTIFSAVSGYNHLTDEWEDGVIIDMTVEFDVQKYCIEPMDNSPSFVTDQVRTIEYSDSDGEFSIGEPELPFNENGI